jgi:hypothetical protein
MWKTCDLTDHSCGSFAYIKGVMSSRFLHKPRKDRADFELGLFFEIPPGDLTRDKQMTTGLNFFSPYKCLRPVHGTPCIIGPVGSGAHDRIDHRPLLTVRFASFRRSAPERGWQGGKPHRGWCRYVGLSSESVSVVKPVRCSGILCGARRSFRLSLGFCQIL